MTVLEKMSKKVYRINLKGPIILGTNLKDSVLHIIKNCQVISLIARPGKVILTKDDRG